MSNIKTISLVVVVPFDWINHASPQDAHTVSALLLSPSIGVVYRYEQLVDRPNPSPLTSTAMYRLHILGQEALSNHYLDALKIVLIRMGAEIHQWSVREIES